MGISFTHIVKPIFTVILIQFLTIDQHTIPKIVVKFRLKDI